jgi:hypothetical protein
VLVLYSFSFYFLCCIVFGIAEIGIARGSLPRTTTEAQRVGFPFVEIRFVLVGTRSMLDYRTSPRNGH